MFHAHAIYALTLRPLVNALVWVVFAAVTVVTLAALTGIFVLWLGFVGVLIAAIVTTDVVQRSLRRFSRPPVLGMRQQPVR